MSDKYSVEFNEPQSGGHPHDLLARLYREIGISAVAAAPAPRRPVRQITLQAAQNKSSAISAKAMAPPSEASADAGSRAPSRPRRIAKIATVAAKIANRRLQSATFDQGSGGR